MYTFLNKIKNIIAIIGQSEKDVLLSHYEAQYFSQNGEDGVLEKIFETIGTTNKYYVEFGVEDGSQCNVKHLKDTHSFNGLLMDMDYENEKINLEKEMVSSENINVLFQKYQVPKQFDLLSIDIDYNDFWVLKALATEYQPRVLVLEINTSIPPNEDKVISYDSNKFWDGTRYFGASLRAMTRLARSRCYTLIYVESTGTNAFFIRNDILNTLDRSFYKQGNINALYRYPTYGPRFISQKYGPVLCKGHPKDSLKRQFVSSNLSDGS